MKVWVWETAVAVTAAVAAAVGGTGQLLARGDVLGGAEEGDYVGIAQSKSARFGEACHLFCEIRDMLFTTGRQPPDSCSFSCPQSPIRDHSTAVLRSQTVTTTATLC
jgi:hypothetical protein